MLETINGNLYDFPKYYDLVYGSDWKAEVDFLEACFDRRDLDVRLRLLHRAHGSFKRCRILAARMNFRAKPRHKLNAG